MDFSEQEREKKFVSIKKGKKNKGKSCGKIIRGKTGQKHREYVILIKLYQVTVIKCIIKYTELKKSGGNKMDYLLDVHTHTLASGHAYNSMMEMAKAGFEKGLKLLGITEHAPMMPGSCNNIYFNNLKVVPRTLCGIEVMLGVELNILDFDGHVDLSNHTLRQLNLKIASLHSVCILPGSREENTRAVLGAIRNPMVDIIGHPDDGIYPLEYEPIVEAAKENHTLLEVNNNSLNPIGARKNTRGNIIRMLELCKEYKQPVIMNSDAHVFADVGRRDFSEELIRELDFPEELIVNRSVRVFKDYLNLKKEQEE